MIYQLDPYFILPIKDDDIFEIEYFSEVIDFICRYLNANLVYSDEFYSQIIDNTSNISSGDSLYCYNLRSQEFYKLLKNAVYIPHKITSNSILLDNIDFPKNTKYIFDSIFEYTKKNDEECIFFLDINNHNKCAIKQIDNVYLINHIYKETSSNIANFIEREDTCIKNINKPSLENYFPNHFLCNQYHNEMKKQVDGLSSESKISIYIEFFREIAKRNGYTEDFDLEDKNKQKKNTKKDKKSNNHPGKTSSIRIIYSSINNTNIHICADVENGAIEVCDSSGTWKGAFSYTGECVTNKKDLKDIKKIQKHSILVN